MSERSATTGPGSPPLSTPTTRGGDARSHGEAQLSQFIGDNLGGPRFAVAELGMLVKVASPRDHLRVQFGGEPAHIGSQRIRASGRLRLHLANAENLRYGLGSALATPLPKSAFFAGEVLPDPPVTELLSERRNSGKVDVKSQELIWQI